MKKNASRLSNTSNSLTDVDDRGRIKFDPYDMITFVRRAPARLSFPRRSHIVWRSR